MCQGLRQLNSQLSGLLACLLAKLDLATPYNPDLQRKGSTQYGQTFLVSYPMILETNGLQSPHYSHCWGILQAS